MACASSQFHFLYYLLAKQGFPGFKAKNENGNYHALFIYNFQYFKKNLKIFYFIQLPVIVFMVLLVLISYSSFRMSSHICNIVIKLLLLQRDIIIGNFDSHFWSSSLFSFLPHFKGMKMSLLTFC